MLRLARVAEDLLQSALDSIASTITLTLYEIAQQPQIVEKLQTEIKELNCENGLRWEHLGDLKYLDMCITGELRLRIGLKFGKYVHNVFIYLCVKAIC